MALANDENKRQANKFYLIGL